MSRWSVREWFTRWPMEWQVNSSILGPVKVGTRLPTQQFVFQQLLLRNLSYTGNKLRVIVEHNEEMI